jgi:hypothetical protein
MSKRKGSKWLVPEGDRKKQAPKTNINEMSQERKVAHKKRINKETGKRRADRFKIVGATDPQKIKRAKSKARYYAN